MAEDDGYSDRDDDDAPRRRLLRGPLGRARDGAARRFKSLSFNRIFPNILTVIAACAGLTGIRYGISGQWDRAVIALVAAAMLDGVDGRVARLLRGTSQFGAELDSLADAINFGVAPAIIMYLWAMNAAGSIGWALCLLHAVCCVLRLARRPADASTALLAAEAGFAQDGRGQQRQRIAVDVADQRHRQHAHGRDPSRHKLRSYPIRDKLRVSRLINAACQRVRHIHLQTNRQEFDARDH